MATQKPTEPEEYYVEIIRDKLSGFEGRISNEEAGASIFLGNEQVTLEGQFVNLAKFRVLDGEVLETLPQFVELGKAPAGANIEWTGVVLIGGRLVAVEMFRIPLPASEE